MSDEEVLCTFMEPNPYVAEYSDDSTADYPSAGGWWLQIITGSGDTWIPRRLTLNECRLIEARLSDEQWLVYIHKLRGGVPFDRRREWNRICIHADAALKITALASVLRQEVQG